MRNARAAAIDNTPVVIASTHDIWLCHDGAGTTLTNENSDGILGDITINGTTAGIWANAGNFTPAGDHTQQKTGGFPQALGDLTNSAFGPAQILFFVDLYATSNPTNFETFLMYGNTSGANLLRFTLEANGRFQAQTKDSAGVTVSASTGSYGSVCDSTRHSVVALVDYANGTIVVYVDGELDGSNSLDTDNPVESHSRGWGVLANITSDTPSFNRELGGDGSGVRINRMGVIRPNRDMSGIIGDIAQGLYEVEHELPRVLHGV